MPEKKIKPEQDGHPTYNGYSINRFSSWDFQVCQESVNMTFNQNFDCQCEFNSKGCISAKTAMEN